MQKIVIFPIIFLNFDNLISIAHKLFKFRELILDIITEGTQIIYLCPSFHFIGFRKCFFLICKMFPGICHKIKTRAYKKHLRHGSLQMGLKNVQTKFKPYICYSF